MWHIVCVDPSAPALGYCAGEKGGVFGWVPPGRGYSRLAFNRWAVAMMWAWHNIGPNVLWQVVRANTPVVEVPF